MPLMHRWLWILPAALSLTSTGAAAVDPKQILSTVTGQSPAVDAPLAARDIPARADADEQFAEDVLQRVAAPVVTEALGPQIEALAAGVTTLGRRMRKADLTRMPVIRLESLQRNWRFYRRQLEAWQREAQRQLDRDSDDAAQLAQRRVTWAATRKEAQSATISPALLERVNAVLARIEAADRALSAPLARQLEFSRRGNAVAGSIAAGLRAVDAASTSFDFRLAVRDSAPLWIAWRDPGFSADALSAAASAVELERDFLRRYLAASRDRLVVHAVFAVLLLPVLLWLRQRSRRLVAQNPDLRDSTQAMMRPVSAWLVLVLVATLFFQSDSPILLHEVALLIAVIPVLRLLPREIFEVLGPWPYAATGLYVLHRLGVLFVAQPLYHRVHLLAVTLLALAALVWIMLQARRRRPAPQATAFERAARVVGLVGIVGLAASVVANVFGNVTLAELLTRGTLNSAYLGLVLYAGATVLGSIARNFRVRRGAHSLHGFAERAAPLLETFARLIRHATLVLWILVTLNQFRVLRPVVSWARRVLNHPLGIGEISVTLGSVLLFLAAVYVAFWIARTMRTVLRDEILGRMALPRGVANSVATLTYYALVVIGVMIALAAAGFEVGQLAIIVGALGVGIGFGLQNVVNNFVSGLILMFERPIQPGDIVEITGTSGKVSAIGMRATTLTTAEGADVVVPNGTLLSEKLINWTLRDTSRRIDVDVGVAHGSDPRQVLELLKQVSLATPGILPNPAPETMLLRFGPNSLDFGIRAWTGDLATAGAVRSDLAVRVHDALKQAGIVIPVPQQDVHIRSVPDSLARGPANHPESSGD